MADAEENGAKKEVAAGRPSYRAMPTSEAVDAAVIDLQTIKTKAVDSQAASAQATGDSSLTRKAVAGTAWSTVSTASRQVLQIISVATVARLLGPSTYGIMGMANVLIVFILNFRDLGTGSAIIQRLQTSNRLLSSLFWLNASLGVLLAIVVSAASPAMAKFFDTPILIPMLCVISSSFLLTSCGVVHASLLYREMRFRALAIVDVSAALAGYLTALTSALNGLGVWSLVYANVANSLVATAGYWIACRWRPTAEFDKAEVRSIASYSLNLSGFGLVNYFSRNADNIVVGRVLGKLPLGAYQMAYNLMLTPIQNISSVIAQATFPAFAKIQNDNLRFRQAYTRSCMLIALITFPVIAGMGVVADPMIRAILGPKWIPAIRVFQILAPVGLVQSIQTTVGPIYMSKGRTDWLFRLGILQCLVYTTAFLIGVKWGITGVATAYCISYLGLMMIPGFVVPFKTIGLRLPDFGRALLPQLLITSAMVLACLGWMAGLRQVNVANSWIVLMSTVMIGTFVYASLLVCFWPRVMDDVNATLGHVQNARVAAVFAGLGKLRMMFGLGRRRYD